MREGDANPAIRRVSQNSDGFSGLVPWSCGPRSDAPICDFFSSVYSLAAEDYSGKLGPPLVVMKSFPCVRRRYLLVRNGEGCQLRVSTAPLTAILWDFPANRFPSIHAAFVSLGFSAEARLSVVVQFVLRSGCYPIPTLGTQYSVLGTQHLVFSSQLAADF